MLKKIILIPFYLLSFLGNFYSLLLSFLNSKYYSKWFDITERNVSKKFLNITHNSIFEKKIFLKFFTPNSRCLGRVKTFSSKEPETLAWMDKQTINGVFYDIGANIGLYSIYYAKISGGKVYSFEPSIFNLEQLAKNINLNELQNNITIISNPLHDKESISKILLNKLDKGGSEAFFGEEIKAKLKTQNYPIKENFSYSLLGLSIDYLTDNGLVESPSCIKIDVDGTEEFILKGAKKTLLNEKLKSVLVEINTIYDPSLIYKILQDCGFELDKDHSTKTNKIFNKQ